MKKIVMTDPASVYCPYFIYETSDSIICEGVTENTYSLHRFARAESKNDWMKEVCTTCRCGSLCPMAQTLTGLYGEDALKHLELLPRFTLEQKRTRRKATRARRKRMQKTASRPRAVKAEEERRA